MSTHFTPCYLFMINIRDCGLESAPVFITQDAVFLLIVVGIVFFVFLRPRNYLRRDPGGKYFSVFHKGKSADQIPIEDLAKLEINAYSRCVAKRRDKGFLSLVKIFSVKHPNIVFFDSNATILVA